MRLEPITMGGIVVALLSSIYMSLWAKNDIYILFPTFLLFAGLFLILLFSGKGKDIPVSEIIDKDITIYYTMIAFLFVVFSSLISKIYVPPRLSLVGFPLIVFSVMIAIAEEVFFRGGLMSFFEWIGLPNLANILLTSMTFTIYHLAVYQSINAWVFVFCAGLVLSYVTRVTGTLAPAMFAHIMNNLMVMMG